jgi:transposase
MPLADVIIPATVYAVTLTRCYKFRLEPTTEQAAKFRQFAGCRRFVWNWALSQKQCAFKNEDARLSYSDLATRLVELKKQPETRFLQECDSQALQQTLLDKSFSDAAHGAFFTMLIYKGLWYDCQVVKVDRFFASSKRCSCCGHQQVLTLAERRWRCSKCGAEHDRDVNAARNLREEGLRLLAQGHGESLNARGEAVRLAKASVPH